MKEAIGAYRQVTATDEFREIERLRSRAPRLRLKKRPVPIRIGKDKTMNFVLTGDLNIVGNYDFLLAEYDDIPEIMNVYHSLIGTPGCTWSLDYPDKETVHADIESNALYVLKESNKIVAVAAAGVSDELAHLQWDLKNPCELARVGVLTQFQKRGVGTIILKNVIAAVEQKGFDGINMLVSKTNPVALALYDKNGFEKRGEVFMYEIDFYCYQMQFHNTDKS
jgi:ribosomal protein S18 acetylase RimI-like enzyme